MFGAILGDYLGSIYEKIPHKPLRTEMICTDDSYLTCATIEWINSLDYPKFNKLSNQNFKYPSQEWQLFEQDLTQKAENFLIKWFDISQNETLNNINSFSSGFTAWVAMKKDPQNTEFNHTKAKGFTNGCLMRNSPIAYFGSFNNLSLRQVVLLTQIFCKVTHPHIDSINATTLHSTLLHFIAKNIVNPNNIKECLTGDGYSLLTLENPIKFSNLNIQPLDFWLNEKISKKFIWDAKTSLDISLSAIYYSNTYLETIEWCNKTQMDTDTYCAIAGPVAELLWGIPEDVKNIYLPLIKQESITNLLIKFNLV